MKFLNITLLFVIIALACHLSLSMAEDSKRPALRRPVGKGGKASTTTTNAPADEEEGDYNENGEENQYGDEGEEGDAASTTTTTTEPPKRIGPVIRPFRSNDDFLNLLKRKQMDAKKGKSEKPAPKAKAAPAAESEDDDEEAVAAAAPASSTAAKGFSKPNSALSRRKLSKPSKSEPAEEPAEKAAEAEPKDDPKAKSPLARLALRKRN